ncbi:MAG: DNA polymerase III subunit delta [Devosia sp.]
MTALKGRDIERFIGNPDLEEGAIVVYGPDGGLVRETAETLVKHYSTGDWGLVTIDGADIDADPGRLAVEAKTSSLFGGRRVVRIRGAAGKTAATPLAALLDEGAGAIVILEAGNLTPKDPLRALAEASRKARALPCYADTDQTILKLINETFSREGVSVAADVATTLRDILGNDREVTRRELEKLSLFAAESKVLTREDVLTLCADNAASALDEVADAIGSGRADALDVALSRALAAAIDGQRILATVTQHFAALRRWRAQFDSGRSAGEALDSGWPKPHFSRRASLEQQVRLWNDVALASAAERLLTATTESRKAYGMSETIMRHALLSLARQAAGN